MRVEDAGAKDGALVDAIRAGPTRIVYVATHKHADAVARRLSSDGIEASAYHAGLRVKEREGVEERFLSGDLPVIVATTALGSASTSLTCALSSTTTSPDRLTPSTRKLGDLDATASGPRRCSYPPGSSDFDGSLQARHRSATRKPRRCCWRSDVRARRRVSAISAAAPNLSRAKVSAALTRLGRQARCGKAPVTSSRSASTRARRRLVSTDQRRTGAPPRVRALARRDDAALRGRTALPARVLAELLRRAVSRAMRDCDNCAAGAGVNGGAEEPFPWFARATTGVGEGSVQHYADDTMTVLFDNSGYRRLLVRAVVEGELLYPADEADRPSTDAIRSMTTDPAEAVAVVVTGPKEVRGQGCTGAPRRSWRWSSREHMPAEVNRRPARNRRPPDRRGDHLLASSVGLYCLGCGAASMAPPARDAVAPALTVCGGRDKRCRAIG